MKAHEKLQKWHAVDIGALPEAAQAIEHLFSILDADGIETDLMPRPAEQNIKVTGYFSKLPTSEIIDSELAGALGIYGLEHSAVSLVATREVVATDWLAEWKKYWKPTVVGKFVIAPPWEVVDDKERIVISIEPNMAFGTGTHETTQLCLQAITDNYRSGQSFLDVGTGTGILAIAAAKLATESKEKDKNEISIFACDTDADSIAIAKENAVLNGVGERITFEEGELENDIPVFDFVCANLTIDVIVPLLPLLLEKTREKLVLSGILLEQKDIIDAELRKCEIADFKFEIAGEWIAVIISKG